MATFRNDGNSTIKVNNYLGNEVVVSPGLSVQTHERLKAPFTKTSEEPFYSPTLVQNMALAVPGFISGLEKCKIINIKASAEEVYVRCNSSENTSYTVIPEGSSVKILNNEGYIDSLHFSVGEGIEDITVAVEGYSEENVIVTIPVTTATTEEEPPV